jgi:hypothetical protein
VVWHHENHESRSWSSAVRVASVWAQEKGEARRLSGTGRASSEGRGLKSARVGPRRFRGGSPISL